MTIASFKIKTMNSFKRLYLLLFAALSFGCVAEVQDLPIQDSDKVPAEDIYVAGVANVCFSEDMALMLETSLADGSLKTKSQDVNTIFEQIGIISARRLFPDAGVYEPRTREADLHRWYRITYREDVAITKAQESFLAMPGVDDFCPERKIELRTVFNDPKFNSQWHYFNNGTISSDFIAGADINVVPVWETFTKGNRDVIVAVIDQGVDATHEDLAANYVGGKNFASGGKVTPGDHGCHVAGTIAAVNNNGKGGCGIAGGDSTAGIEGVGILSCQIFSGNLPVGGAEAIKWAADNGAVIANNSWGYSFEKESDAASATISNDLKAAIDYFIAFAGCDNQGNQLPDSPMKGGVVFFSAGNDGWKYDPIGQYDPVISVGSIGPDMTRAYYSNYGSWVDIAAPGGNLTINRGGVYSSVTENKYDYLQGTSMACPHISGVAALIVSYFGGPGFTNDMLKERLFAGARYDALSPVFNIGPLVDAMGAFTAGGTIAPDKVEDFTFDVTGNKIVMNLAVTADEDDVKTFEYLVLMSENKADLESLDVSSLPDGVKEYRFKVGNVGVGEKLSMRLPNLDFEKEYHFIVAGYDYSQNYAEWSPVRSVRTGKNNAPVARPADGISDIIVRSHEIVTTHFTAYDPEEEELHVSLKETMPGVSVSNAGGEQWNLSINGRAIGTGKHSGEVVVTDVHGLSSSFIFTFEVLPNNAPVVVREIEDIYEEGAGNTISINLSDHISDPDGEILSYKVNEGNRMVAKVALEEDVLNVNISGFGSSVITVTASDALGASCVIEINVMVKNPDNLVEMFPVPVVDILTIRTGMEASTDITISTVSGQVVYDQTSMVSAFNPAKIDMSSYAPGKYKVTVIIGSDKTERTIAKI